MYNPLLVERGIRSLLGVPLLVGDDLLGVLHVGSVEPRRFTEDDTTLLQLVGDRIALAAQARISRAERSAARTLQRSLLPPRLPDVPGLEFAARYVPGDGEIGGDWYDVFAVPDGRLVIVIVIVIVIGDVAGSGLNAAITMGRLRTVFRAHAIDIVDPAELLTKVDEHIDHFEPATMTTVLCACLHPGDSTLRISAAGHPPPALAAPGVETRILDLPHDLPLGINITRQRNTTDIRLAKGSSICFFTDGLVERRNQTIDVGPEHLCRAVAPDDAETVCSTVMSRLVGREQAHDDIAVLALAREGNRPAGPATMTPQPAD